MNRFILKLFENFFSFFLKFLAIFFFFKEVER